MAIGYGAYVNGNFGTALGTGAYVGGSGLCSTALGAGASTVGAYDTALGSHANATGKLSTAVGAYALAIGNLSTALGASAKVNGNYSTALGGNAYVAGLGSTALGFDTHVVGTGSTALGESAKVNGNNSIALGASASVTDNFSTALGSDAQVVGAYSAALGGNAYIAGPGSTALGFNAHVVGTGSTAVGDGARVESDYGTALGDGAYVGGSFSTALGSRAKALGADSISIGHGSVVNGNDSGAFGGTNKITGNGSFAAGNNNVIGANNAFVLGNDVTIGAGLDGAVALGDHSVVTVSNPTASAAINGVTYRFAGAAPAPGGVVSVGAAGAERQIQNVAAGQLSTASTDAVNGSQLYATNQAIATVNGIASAGWNLSSNGGAGVNIAPGATVDVAEGNNIVVTQDAATGDLTIATSMLPTFTSVTTTGGLIVGGMFNANGGFTVATGQNVDMGGNQIHDVATGTANDDAVNVDQLNTAVGGLQGQINIINQGGSGAFQVSADSAGSPSPTGTNSVAGGANATASGSDSVALGNASTASGTGSTAVGEGAQATGDNSVALGTGSVASEANTVSVGSKGHERKITNVAAGTAPTDAVNVGQLQSVAAGGVQYDANADGSTNYNSVTLDPGGGDPTTIHNVAAGVADNDAVNLGQMNTAVAGAVTQANEYTDQRYNELRGSLNRADNRANAGIASAIAAASLPQPYAPNQNSLGVGLGSFHGEAGIAVGLSRITESGRFILKANVSSDTRGDMGAGVGAGIVW